MSPTDPSALSRVSGTRAAALRTLNPGYFALVMATGIVSIGLRDHRVPALSAALMWLTAFLYLVLVVLYGGRAVLFPAEFRRDLTNPARSFAFFTFVAGTDVLGSAFALADHLGTAEILLVVGGLGWLVLGYVIPWIATLGNTDRPVVAGANGTWFIWVVATQSVAVLAALVEPTLDAGRRELALLAVCCWAIGTVLYAVVGVLIAARLLLYEIRPADLAPPYWVAMGATAISVLAAARILRMASAPVVSPTHGVIAATSVVFWAFGSWLIPPLIAAGWWRHAVHRVPLRYEPSWWSVVFPLGMYGVASRTIGGSDHLPLVTDVGRYEIWIALAAWAATFAAMLTQLMQTIAHRPE